MGEFLIRIYDELLGLVRRYRSSSLRFGSTVVVKAFNGTVLRVDNDGYVRGHGLLSDEHAVFVIVDATAPFAERPRGRIRSGQAIGLRSPAKGAFWGINYDDDRVLTCNYGALREWQTFELESVRQRSGRGRYVQFGDDIALRSFATWHYKEWRYLQYRLETSKLCRANARRIGGWETFVFLSGEKSARPSPPT